MKFNTDDWYRKIKELKSLEPFKAKSRADNNVWNVEINGIRTLSEIGI